jgi:ribose transport system permease protein
MPDLIKRFQLQKLLAMGALVILYVFFAFFGNNFMTVPTTLNILGASYFVGFLAIGVTFVIITGGIDLSIGTVMMTSSLIAGVLHNNHGVPLWICLIVMVLAGTLFGLFNGILVTRLKLPPFIATLGTMMISMGLGSIITNITTQRFPGLISPEGGWFTRLFIRTEANFPSGAVFLLVFFIIMTIVLKRTKIGRYIYAIGSNEEAVRLSGIKAHNWKGVAYIISGFCAGVAAVFYSAMYLTIVPGTGNGFELQAIAAVVIGGTSLAGGVGSVSGTIIGVFIMSVLSQGLVSVRLPQPYQVFFTGVVVIGAVLLDTYRNKKANEVKKT